MRTLLSKIRAIFSKQRLDDDFNTELEAHIAMLTDENLRRGFSPDEARRAAILAIGGVTRVKEERREGRSFTVIEAFFKDLRYAVRMLLKNPGFTLVAVITLALGIGVNTTLFTAFNAVALKPLPVRDPYNVVRLERWFENGNHGDVQYAFSYPEYVHFNQQNQAFSSLTAVSWPEPVLAALASGSTETLHARLVSANYFPDLGVTAFLGRTFLPEEDQIPGAHPVMMLSYALWRDRFHSDPNALGQIIKVNDTSFTIVGVAPEEFIGTGIPSIVPDFWTPIMMQAQLTPGQNWLDNPLDQRFQILARPKPGISVKQAQAEIAGLQQRFTQLHPSRNRTLTVTLELAHYLPNTNDPRFQVIVGLMMIVVGMVLFIACANLANMLLARSAARRKELTVRLALGAGRSRLIRQLLTESTLIAVLGGISGLFLSIWASKVLWLAIQQWLQGPFGPGAAFLVSLSPDSRVFTYTLLISIATGILFGLSPALRFSRVDLTSGLKDEATAFGQRLDRSRLRSFLIAGQIATSLMLLITAGLLVRGLVRSQAVDPGYETRSVYLVSFNYGSDAAKALAIQRRAIDRLRELPQVRSVTLTGGIPMAGTTSQEVQSDDTRSKSFSSDTLLARVAPQYFETLGIPLLNGRNFTPQEMDRGAPVAIISELTARQMWPDENPLGRHFKLQDRVGRTTGPWVQYDVIGVAKSVRTANLSRLDPMMLYLPIRPASLENILMRTEGDPKIALAAVRSTLESIDRNIPPSLQLISLEQGPLHFEKVQARIWAMSAMSLAVLALALATVGIYGVMSYLVSQQTREIGILMALGATARDVLRSVILQGLRPVFIGSVFGLAGAVAITSLLRATLIFASSPDFLYGVRMFDPVTFLGLSALLALVALLASAIPAWRAIKVDPMIALRYE
ncbi:MAG TPA: ABC transporter permease [Bryobacteraceae bacterium]|nr:ABC transporter permease [Bryobacteraceae bacterium]